MLRKIINTRKVSINMLYVIHQEAPIIPRQISAGRRQRPLHTQRNKNPFASGRYSDHVLTRCVNLKSNCRGFQELAFGFQISPVNGSNDSIDKMREGDDFLRHHYGQVLQYFGVNAGNDAAYFSTMTSNPDMQGGDKRNMSDQRNDSHAVFGQKFRSTAATYINIPIFPNNLKSTMILPEVQSALDCANAATNGNSQDEKSVVSSITTRALPDLERAMEIFSYSPSTQKERRTVLLLQGQFQSMSGLHLEASKTYAQLLKELKSKPTAPLIPLPLGAHEMLLLELAQAKASFHAGLIKQAHKLCYTILTHQVAKIRDRANNCTSSKEDMLKGHTLPESSNFTGDSSCLTTRNALSLYRGCAQVGLGLSDLLMLLNEAETDQNVILLPEIYNHVLSTLQDGCDELLDAYQSTVQINDVKSNNIIKAGHGETITTTHGQELAEECSVVKLGSTELALAAAAALNNLGIAQALQETSSQTEKFTDLHLLASIQTWNKALELLETVQGDGTILSSRAISLATCLNARFHANIAWRVLQHQDHISKANSTAIEKDDNLKIATQHAKRSLELYEQAMASMLDNSELPSYHEAAPITMQRALRPGVGRALSLLATCYERAGKAVTAEGLLRTAADMVSKGEDARRIGSPLSYLLAHDVNYRLADLCDHWGGQEGKRSVEAKKLRELATQTSLDSLPNAWHGTLNKAGICGALWFTHPGDFISCES